MQRLLNYLRTKIKTWRDNRFLKKHGCETWEQYNYRFDPDVVKPATRVKDYYHGYPYFYCFENHKHDVYHWDVGYDGMYILSQWIDANCKGKYRFDFLRVFQQTPIGLNGAESSEWHINELGGGDYIFVAFKEHRDYTWFMLRWS
jgi:hypothetical protein